MAAELHTDFRLSPESGTVVLARMQAGKPVTLDYLDYTDLAADKAWGSLPDGDPLRRQFFHQPTPGRANTAATPPLLVFVNEWMASNAGIFSIPRTRIRTTGSNFQCRVDARGLVRLHVDRRAHQRREVPHSSWHDRASRRLSPRLGG